MPKYIIDNKRTISPSDLKPGDVLITTITCHILPDGEVRYYDCGNHQSKYFAEVEGVPQGGVISRENSIESLFPASRMPLPYTGKVEQCSWCEGSGMLPGHLFLSCDRCDGKGSKSVSSFANDKESKDAYHRD